MNLVSSLLISVAGATHPVFGVVGSIVKYFSSSSETCDVFFLIDISTCFLPTGMLGKLLIGLSLDVAETSFPSAIKKTVPYRKIVLRCERCSNHTHYYVSKDGEVICQECLSKDIERQIAGSDRILLHKNNVHSKWQALRNSQNAAYAQHFWTARNKLFTMLQRRDWRGLSHIVYGKNHAVEEIRTIAERALLSECPPAERKLLETRIKRTSAQIERAIFRGNFESAASMLYYLPKQYDGTRILRAKGISSILKLQDARKLAKLTISVFSKVASHLEVNDFTRARQELLRLPDQPEGIEELKRDEFQRLGYSQRA